jgi:endonuclease III-like uncharacterized protein
MKLIDFVNIKMEDFSNFSGDRLFELFESRILNAVHGEFNNAKELSKYVMQDGDKISLAQCIIEYKENNTLHIDFLNSNVKDISGLSERIINNIQSELGDVFKIDDLKSNRKNITGLGKKTTNSIIEYVESKKE